ncbi:hypothetical protein PsYK624_112760 [Phanerochaete sordida]|uniref:F-box domain-containing protein n=1 Tax=Phanerochaete sordida TaxID=48140 RepID=A0A9P3LH23_9APHY|nr:hypothetical protein PsYK624_112760 [Phanerochaete sordida]
MQMCSDRGLEAYAPPELPAHKTCMNDLPQELVDLILDALKDESKALKSCSLTCWTWHPRSSKHLFASYNLTSPSADSSARITAMQAYERIRTNIVVLTLRTQYVSTLPIIHALPHLRDLNVIASGMHTRMLDAFLSVPPPRSPPTRTISRIRIRDGSVGLVELVLRSFALVETLIIEDLRVSPVNVHHLARHAIRSLHLRRVSLDALKRVSLVIEPTVLEYLLIDSPSHREPINDTHLDKFLHAIGSYVRSYHYVDSADCHGYPYKAVPPTLSLYPNVRSVTVTIGEFETALPSQRGQHLLTFLSSLPPEIAEITLIYNTPSRGPDLIDTLKYVDWSAISHPLRGYAKLTSLRIGVASVAGELPTGRLLCLPLAQAVVAEMLCVQLRRITTFI